MNEELNFLFLKFLCFYAPIDWREKKIHIADRWALAAITIFLNTIEIFVSKQINHLISSINICRSVINNKFVLLLLIDIFGFSVISSSSSSSRDRGGKKLSQAWKVNMNHIEL